MKANQQQFATVAATPRDPNRANDKAFDLRRRECTMKTHLTAKRPFKIIAATAQREGVQSLIAGSSKVGSNLLLKIFVTLSGFFHFLDRFQAKKNVHKPARGNNSKTEHHVTILPRKKRGMVEAEREREGGGEERRGNERRAKATLEPLTLSAVPFGAFDDEHSSLKLSLVQEQHVR